MAYTVYTTPALVCGAFDRNTADRSVMLFTRDAGMIYAQVKSVREERSKNRYGLTEFSHLNVSLVRGKTGWRVVGVEPLGNIYSSLTSREERTLVRNSIRLLRRLVRGEEPHAVLYELVATTLTQKHVDPRRAEYELSYKMLAELGYVQKMDITDIDSTVLEREIDHALKQSHL